MPDVTLRDLHKQERQLWNTLETIQEFTTSIRRDPDEHQIEVRLGMLDGALDKFYTVRRQIEAATENASEKLEVEDEDQEAENFRIISQFENRYCDLKSVLSRLRSQHLVPCTSVPVTNSTTPTSRVRLPDIKLPTFAGQLMQWVTFRDTFQSLIHENRTLSAIDKFTYLRTSLAGEALQEIGAIDLTAANYDVAWDALEKRYENKKLILKTHLDLLFAVEPVKREQFESLNHLLSTFDKNLQMIDKIGVSTREWSVLLAYILNSKLDPTTRRSWESHHNSRDFVKYEELVEFLRDHCIVLQSISSSSHSERQQSKSITSHPVSVDVGCHFCSGSRHSVFQCLVFRRMNIDDRVAASRTKKLCFNCLASGHMVNKCTKGSCSICKRRHHTLLHEAFSTQTFPGQTTTRPHVANFQRTPPPQFKPQDQNRATPTQSTQHLTQTLAQGSTSRPTTDNTVLCNQTLTTPDSRNYVQDVLLSTAIVCIRDQYGHELPARALLDSASQRNLMTTTFAQKLRCKRVSSYLRVKGVGSSETISTSAVTATVSSLSSRNPQYSELMNFHVLSKVTTMVPSKQIEIQHLELPKEIDLADPHFNTPGAIDVIIGAEHYYDLLSDGKFKLGYNGPTIHNTVFGWVVSGAVDVETTSLPMIIVHASSVESEQSFDLREQLSKFWELETCRITTAFSTEELACEEWFNNTTFRDDTGRFVVTLPKKQGMLCKLGDSKAIATKRFLGMEKRLQANVEMKTMYNEFIEEYQRMGHMVEVAEGTEESLVYYLPHHAVFKPDSSTTKLRVVFDASCSTSTGMSLNDVLMVGPVVQNDLLTIIMRFRIHRYAVVADIAKMYRMVNVHHTDHNLQRILWRDSPSNQIRTFRLTTVTYGTASAPYLATKCLQTLAEHGKFSHPVASNVIRNDLYVDDLLSGGDSVEEVQQLVTEAIELLESAGFTLRKWKSNHDAVLEDVPAELCDDGIAKELDSSSATVKTLGLVWEPSTDVFRFKTPKWGNDIYITKRMVLADTARIFDPLGLIAPIVVLAKIFLQELWKEQTTWDEILSIQKQAFWLEFRKNMASLQYIAVPRWIGYDKCAEIELHGFCDASEKAYGACIYVRSVWIDKTITVNLLTSKSRVAPLNDIKRKQKKQSIPRLELSAALLLSHLYEKVKGSLPFPVQCYCWTDSMIVRYWLKSSPSRWQPFVSNRVAEIQHLTTDSVWEHVAGVDNPADVISRGMIPSQLKCCSLWWSGPQWLKHNRTTWAHAEAPSPEELTLALQEQKATVSFPVQIVSSNDIFTLRSSLSSLVRLTALLCRFAYNANPINRNNKCHGFITYQEHESALLKLVRLSQTECFSTEIQDLINRTQVKESSRINALNPILVDGIIHVGGRLRNAAVSVERKHPIILDHRHPLTRLIMRHYHHKFFHAGQQLLISCVRERFWPINARRLARQIIHECVPCFRCKPKVEDQLMADLPQERVNPAPAFLKVGVDYCGPFIMSYPGRKARPSKCFIAVFVCLVTKAIHMEIVSDLTTQAFLAALKRFIARRGKPQVIMSDNAKNFIGAKRAVDELAKMFRNQQFQETVTRQTIDDGIEFKFIPARSPNFGGLWEAAVKSFKGHLKKTIGTRTLSYDELNTTVVQIEACLNSRPLTPLSSDPNDLEVLTPGHFIIQRPLTSVAEPYLGGIAENRLSMWQRSQHFVQQVWKKWSSQYLSTLHNRTKWTRRRNNLAIGTMVLLKEENLPPLKWQLGRVTKIYIGSDGNVRVAVVRTKDGSYERGISKICVLPIEENTLPSQDI